MTHVHIIIHTKIIIIICMDVGGATIEKKNEKVMDVCVVEDDQEFLSKPTKHNASINQEEFDLVEPPAEDFFCPVTFELLLNPHQTTCCGHHLSEKAVNRLQREGKPCPMCKETELVTTSDKYFKRKASAILIRCPHKASGCEWVGEVGGSKQHINTCPKRPWNCQHCDFKSTFEAGIQHVEECTNYPIPCPNKCEIPVVSQALPLSSNCQPQTQICMIPRCDIEKHLAECPLEMVACEFADVGCKVRTTRQELKRHMEESQQEHLLSATLLNLRLTRETIADKDRQIAEIERRLNEKIHEEGQLLAEKDLKIAVLEEKLAQKDRQVAEKDRLIAEKDQRLAKMDEHVAAKNGQMLDALIRFQHGATGGNHYMFTLEEFSECQKKGLHGDWFSGVFDVGSRKYKLKLNVETKERGPHMTVRLYRNDKKSAGLTFVLELQLLNQLSDHGHYLRQWEATPGHDASYSDAYEYIEFKVLYNEDRNTKYLMNDCIKFVLWIKKVNTAQ